MPKQKSIPVDQIDSKKAFDRHEKIAGREKMRRALFLENMLDLYEMFEGQEFKVILGPDVKPAWSAYLGQVEVYYSRSQVERWRKIWQALVIDLQVKPDDIIDVPESRLEDIAKHSNSQTDAYTLIAKAKLLSSQEWKDSLFTFLGKPDSYDCKHTEKIYSICSKCGKKHQIDAGQESHEQSNSKV